MIGNEILGVVGILTGIVIMISTLGFVYFMWSAYKYGSRDEANKFFGSFMFNHPKRYIIAFLFLVSAGISLSIGFIFAFISSFFINPLSIWEFFASLSLIALSGFFVTFTSVDHPKVFLSYIKFLKTKKKDK
jgi:hypothetical protein